MKKTYETPELTTLGDVEKLTLGEGIPGDADQLWIFSWGEDPDQPSIS